MAHVGSAFLMSFHPLLGVQPLFAFVGYSLVVHAASGRGPHGPNVLYVAFDVRFISNHSLSYHVAKAA